MKKWIGVLVALAAGPVHASVFLTSRTVDSSRPGGAYGTTVSGNTSFFVPDAATPPIVPVGYGSVLQSFNGSHADSAARFSISVSQTVDDSGTYDTAANTLVINSRSTLNSTLVSKTGSASSQLTTTQRTDGLTLAANGGAARTWQFSTDQVYRYWIYSSTTGSSASPPSSTTGGGAASGGVDFGTPSSPQSIFTSSSNHVLVQAGLLNVGSYLLDSYVSQAATLTRPQLTFNGVPTVAVNGSSKCSLSLAPVGAAAVAVGVVQGASYNSISAVPTGSTTTASLLDGTSSAEKTVNLAVDTTGVATGIVGKKVTLSGTGGDVVVLQLEYDPAGVADPTRLRLGWFNSTGQWVNAIAGNSDGGAGGVFHASAYDPVLDSALSSYGVDTANHTVWAVVDHNSDFGVVVVPEPSTLALTALATVALLARRHRRSR